MTDHVPLKPGPTIRVRFLPPTPLKPVSGTNEPDETDETDPVTTK